MPEGLSVKNCTIKYPGSETNALGGVSFEMPRGSFFVLAGASGSGKTTLLRSIAGLLDLYGGAVEWNSELVRGPADTLVPGHPQIKLVGQELELQEKMTVAENLKHALRAFSEPYRSTRIEELLALCRLTGLHNRLPAQLSGGQRQRVVWATVLADEPELLLLDEPFSHLDMNLRAELSLLLKEIRDELQITVLMVTHDPVEALSLGEYILLLKHGRVEMLDTPRRVYYEPVSAYAAAFFGEANFFSSKELSALDVDFEASGAGKWVLRPEFVHCSQNAQGIKAKVVDCQFRGAYYLATLKAHNGKLLKAVVTQPLEIGAVLFAGVAASRLHPIGS